MLRVSRPMDVVVLNDCVTLTKVTLLRSRAGQAVDLVDSRRG